MKEQKSKKRIVIIVGIVVAILIIPDMPEEASYGCFKVCKKTFFISIIVLIVFFICGQLFLPKEKEIFDFQCDEFEAEWEQVLDSGDRVPTEVPGKVEAESGEVVRYVTILPEGTDENKVLAFRTVWQDAQIYVGDELRADYSTKETRPFGKNSAFRYVFVELEQGDAGKELTYCLSTQSKYSGTFCSVH